MNAVLKFLFVIFYTSFAHAEYRAFELSIENTETGSSRTVMSNLDQIQYPGYHPLSKNEVIHYVDSWMCYDNMGGFKPPCKKPERLNTSTPPTASPPQTPTGAR